jgi:hypothetical protein
MLGLLESSASILQGSDVPSVNLCSGVGSGSSVVGPDLGCAVSIGAVETLGGGVTDGEFTTLEDILRSFALWGGVGEESLVPSRAVPLGECAVPSSSGTGCARLEGGTHPTVGPNTSSLTSSGGDNFVGVISGLRRGGSGGAREQAGLFSSSGRFTSSANVTVFLELADAGEEGLRDLLLDLRHDLTKPCPTLGLNSFFNLVSRLITSYSSDPKSASARDRS